MGACESGDPGDLGGAQHANTMKSPRHATPDLETGEGTSRAHRKVAPRSGWPGRAGQSGWSTRHVGWGPCNDPDSWVRSGPWHTTAIAESPTSSHHSGPMSSLAAAPIVTVAPTGSSTESRRFGTFLAAYWLGANYPEGTAGRQTDGSAHRDGQLGRR